MSFYSFGGKVSCTGEGNRINGRISAESRSGKMQVFDTNLLNLRNNTQNNSVAQNNSAISITLADFNAFTAVGKTWLNYSNDNASFSMNIGSANNSTPQTWALPANFLTYFNGAGRGDFIAVGNVPAALQVAGANKVMRTAYYDENDRPMDVYDHYNFAADGVYHIGSSYDLEVGSDDTFDESDYEVADVPFDLNDNYSSTSEETDHITNQKTLKEVFTVNVDAFGTITTPTGTYDCLRMLTSIQKYTRPNNTVAYTLVSTTNHVGFLTKTGEYFTAKVSGTSGNVTVSEIEYRTVVQTSLLSEGNDVKLNNDSKGVTINIDNDTAHPSAILDVKSDSLGILIPRIAQSNRPSSPATGLLVYQIDNTPGFYYFDGTNWQRLGSTPSARLVTESTQKVGGKGRLTNGSSFIRFNSPVENFENLQINIQLEGDCNGVFISKKTREGFEVKELQKGKSNIEFSWKIINE
ncbi:hypothetical protein GCM10011514_19200 [Emticicia aquatilis]|uniref:Uncharacterized protein n=1 Tax=Emticicia aquatilis TaxID=1537369 RepID=A0A916YQ05_9BACT|nr:hypothetical protein [Emticicia aquatilis]GGD55165.1 hypothetical protein GCM10011514_19200 [Emticicia aquatilis]